VISTGIATAASRPNVVLIIVDGMRPVGGPGGRCTIAGLTPLKQRHIRNLDVAQKATIKTLFLVDKFIGLAAVSRLKDPITVAEVKRLLVILVWQNA